MESVESYILNVNDAVITYSSTVYKIALARTGNKHDADDIFQEVFLRLTKHASKITSEEHAKWWLIRVTINCCKTYFRFWKTKPLDVSDFNVVWMPEENDIYQSVLRLPPKYRDVIHLFYYEQLSVKEISDVLKIKEPTIKSQLSRGRNILKDTLERRVAQ